MFGVYFSMGFFVFGVEFVCAFCDTGLYAIALRKSMCRFGFV